jgi:hypothetical protein
MKVKSPLIAGVILLIIAIAIAFFYNSEGFQAGMAGIRCGVDLPGCSSSKQCLNGFCSSTNKPALLANQLPVYP